MTHYIINIGTGFLRQLNGSLDGKFTSEIQNAMTFKTRRGAELALEAYQEADPDADSAIEVVSTKS